MKKFLTLTALAAVLSISAAANADAFQRHGTVTGPYGGTASVHAYGGCAGGVCSRNVTRTGPYGYTANRNGSVSCAGGQCSGSVTTTGPYGNTVVRQGTISRW